MLLRNRLARASAADLSISRDNLSSFTARAIDTAPTSVDKAASAFLLRVPGVLPETCPVTAIDIKALLAETPAGGIPRPRVPAEDAVVHRATHRVVEAPVGGRTGHRGVVRGGGGAEACDEAIVPWWRHRGDG